MDPDSQHCTVCILYTATGNCILRNDLLSSVQESTQFGLSIVQDSAQLDSALLPDSAELMKILVIFQKFAKKEAKWDRNIKTVYCKLENLATQYL